MVSEKKKLAVKELKGELVRYPVIGMLDMLNLPARQLQDIRDKLRGKAVIKMVRKNVMKLAIEGSNIKGLEKIESEIKIQPALLLSEVNPFELAKIIESSKSSAPVKPGNVATKDIIVKAGPTALKPGPVIGELQRVKIPAGVGEDKIIVKEDTIVVKEGEEVTKPVADVLMKLRIEPAEISLNLLAVYDRGTIYRKDVLFIPREKYENDLINAYRCAFNLALNIGLPTAETLPLLFAKAHQEAVSLALEANIMTKETLGNLLANAQAEAEALKEKVGDLEVKEEVGKGKEEEVEEKVGKEKVEDVHAEEKVRVEKKKPEKNVKKKELKKTIVDKKSKKEG
ncbi:MAG: 50S ribosomal protein L10 [Candidatus Aenigmarchaeota archaeon]